MVVSIGQLSMKSPVRVYASQSPVIPLYLFAKAAFMALSEDEVADALVTFEMNSVTCALAPVSPPSFHMMLPGTSLPPEDSL